MDAEMIDKLKQVGSGFARRVRTFNIYDVNGYRFRTRKYEENRGNLKTMCYGVRMPGTDGKEYYGIVKEIYELSFGGDQGFKPVVFKCHCSDPDVTRKDPTIGQVNVRQDSKYEGKDVYIVANRDTTQVYYFSWACQKDKNLVGWSLVQLVSPRGKAAVPKDDDYNFDPKIDEFYQPEGLEGSLQIDILSLMGMEVDDDIDEDEGDEVQDAEDLRILEQWKMEHDRVVENDVEQDDEDDGDDEDDRDDEDDVELDSIDSDDDSSDDEDTPAILPFMEIIFNSCYTILLLLLLPSNYVSLQVLVIYLFILYVLIFVIAGTRQNARRKEAATTKGSLPAHCSPTTLRRTRAPTRRRRPAMSRYTWSPRPVGVGGPLANVARR